MIDHVWHAVLVSHHTFISCRVRNCATKLVGCRLCWVWPWIVSHYPKRLREIVSVQPVAVRSWRQWNRVNRNQSWVEAWIFYSQRERRCCRYWCLFACLSCDFDGVVFEFDCWAARESNIRIVVKCDCSSVWIKALNNTCCKGISYLVCVIHNFLALDRINYELVKCIDNSCRRDCVFLIDKYAWLEIIGWWTCCCDV